MRAVEKFSRLLFVVLMAHSANATDLPRICGEWTGSRPANGRTLPKEQKWVLTFQKDQSFSLVIVEDKIRVPGCEGNYSVSSSNIVIQLPSFPPIPIAYTIQEDKLQIGFSRVTSMHGWGMGVESYVRTKGASELKPLMKQKLLREGQYELNVTLAKDNDPAVLKKAFGEQYEPTINKPINGGTFQLRQLQGRNVLMLPENKFGPAEFNGDKFTVFGAVSSKVNGDFSGEIISATKIEGDFKSRLTTLHGTFTFEKVSD